MRDVNHLSNEKILALLVRHMKTGQQTERVQTLLANLQHFDHCPDFGDSEAVAVIRKHLMVRIREAESAIQYSRLQQQAMAKSVVRSCERLPARAEAA